MADYDPITIYFTPDELERLDRPSKAVKAGGAQRLLRKLLPQVDRTKGSLRILPTDIVLCERYTKGEGGWQRQFQIITDAVARARTAGRQASA